MGNISMKSDLATDFSRLVQKHVLRKPNLALFSRMHFWEQGLSAGTRGSEESRRSTGAEYK